MKKLNLRLPDELYAQLREQAELDHRSLNAEILWLLSKALTGQEARQ